MNGNDQSIKGFRPELFAKQAQEAMNGKGLPPVDLWNPDFCGTIDMHIKRDGSWDYMGTPITRPAMIKLFSTILRRDDDGEYYLVTPVEKVGIRVDDAPFVAVEMEQNEGDIIFRTNVDDYVTAGNDHPIRVEINKKTGEPTPYVKVRGRLEALIARPVFYQLAEYAVKQDGRYGVKSANQFFPLD